MTKPKRVNETVVEEWLVPDLTFETEHFVAEVAADFAVVDNVVTRVIKIYFAFEDKQGEAPEQWRTLSSVPRTLERNIMEILNKPEFFSEIQGFIQDEVDEKLDDLTG